MARKLIRAAGRAAGRKGTWRRRWSVVFALLIAVGAASTVMGVHDDGLFELDRNVANGAAPGEDWENVYCSNDSPTDPDCGAIPNDTSAASTFVRDVVNGTIFTTGASKDDLNTPGWRHTGGSVPDKDELADAFAARYGNILYFGADRIASNGAAQMGFWFFQGNVQAQANGTFGPDPHFDGDILVLSDFTKGGDLPTVRVFQWNPPDGPNGCVHDNQASCPADVPANQLINGTLVLLAGTTATPQDCVANPSSNDPFCATVNDENVIPPWPFAAKSGPAGRINPGQLYEGGIDLEFLDLENECFASFLAETRSSPSVDATLKDFVGGQFQPCDSATVTTPSDAQGNPVQSIVLGDTIYDRAVVTGTGSTAFPTGDVFFWICAPDELDADGLCSTGGTPVPQAGTGKALAPLDAGPPPTSRVISDGFVPDVPGTWCWRAFYEGDNNYPESTDFSEGECFDVLQLQPTMTTAQTWAVFDTAQISVGAGAGNLAGSLKFELWVNSTTCQGTAALTTTKSISGSSPQSDTSGTFTITLPSNSTYSWKVTYTSTNPGHKNVAGSCNNENSSLSFTNGVSEPPATP